jgi:hypothetical protein
MDQETVRWAELSTSVRLSYVSVGPESAAPVVVLLHAWESPAGALIDLPRCWTTPCTRWRSTNAATPFSDKSGGRLRSVGHIHPSHSSQETA